MMFDHKLKLFLEDLDREILATPTGRRREELTEARIVLMALQDNRSQIEEPDWNVGGTPMGI
jgi:hypothetical protein